MRTVTKKELARQIAHRLGFSQRVSLELVNAFFTELSLLLGEKKNIKFFRFGQFVSMKHPERRGLHPVSGKEIRIPAGERVVFRPSRTLKAIVNGKRERKEVLSHR
ncbi:MAG: HU family DNA-binding protein [Deltaproteobacteria bacterium]|nr:HU family DNA-binding protein [Deltaproteobacteria bacterium]